MAAIVALDRLWDAATSDVDDQALRRILINAGVLAACTDCAATYPPGTRCEFCGTTVPGAPPADDRDTETVDVDVHLPDGTRAHYTLTADTFDTIEPALGTPDTFRC